MRKEKTMVSDARALDWREILGRNRAVVSWLYHIIEHGWFISAVKSIQGSYGIPTALNGQHAWWSSENRSLIEGIFMEVTTRAQYFKQTSLSPVWRLYLPVSCVTMLKRTVQSVFMTKWYEFDLRVLSWWLAHVGSRVCSRIIPSFLWPLGFCTEIRVRKLWKIWRCEIVLLCHLWLGLGPEYYVTVPPMMCFFSSLHFFMVLSHCLLYHRVRRFLSAVVLNLRRCRVMSSHYSLLSSSSKHCTW